MRPYWSTPYGFGEEPTYHAQEVHAIEVDPTNPANIYVDVDDENADEATLGLWRSLTGGDPDPNNGNAPFTHMTPNSPYVGIDFTFQETTHQLLLETDGAGGYPSSDGGGRCCPGT